MLNFEHRSLLRGSERSLFSAHWISHPNVEDEVVAVVQLRRSIPLDARMVTSLKRFLSRSEYRDEHSAIQSDINVVYAFANAYNLDVVRVNKEQRLIHLRATADLMEKAFGFRFRLTSLNNKTYRTRISPLFIPDQLIGVVVGIFGLDDRPQASPYVRFKSHQKGLFGKPDGFDGQQLANIYSFPPGDGAGQAIALIELGGGYRQSDLETFFNSIGQKAPQITSVSVLGAKNSPGLDPFGADMEVALDIEVVGAVVPAAKIIAYFAPNTDAGFLQAILTAIHDAENNPRVISISWGAPESEWTDQSLIAMNDAFKTAAALGISVFCAAGDNGAGDGLTDRPHADFPASSPFCTACGGTKLTIANGIRNEVVWNEDANQEGATGGGVSEKFERPYYQDGIGIQPDPTLALSFRGIPDVAAVADPNTGYAIFADHLWNVIGGTSAVAPLFSGLTVRINANLSRPSGLINPPLYANKGSGFNDVSVGNNTYGGVTGFQAGIGWDAASGWGSPNGNALQSMLTPPPTQTPQNT